MMGAAQYVCAGQITILATYDLFLRSQNQYFSDLPRMESNVLVPYPVEAG